MSQTKLSRTLFLGLVSVSISACAVRKTPAESDAQPAPDATVDAAPPTPDSAFADADGDGIIDGDEGAWMQPPRDTDADGTPDYLDPDSDNDGVRDDQEGTEDWDGDGMPNNIDPRNDGVPPEILLTAISTNFNTPIGIDYHEPTKSVVMSVNYGTGGVPSNFERIDVDGVHQMFSAYSGLTDEVKIGTARSGNPAGIPAGTLYTGNGLDGQIVRISPDGSVIDNPWVSLPGDNNGLMRGSLYVDRTGLYAGDIIIATSVGEIWRVTKDGTPTKLATTGVHLEGMITVPNIPVRFGPLAGKIIAGAEQQGLLYAFSDTGETTTYNVGVNIEDIEIVEPKENFFGVNYGTGRLLGASAENLRPMVGDILLTTEYPSTGASGLFRLQWTGTALEAVPVPLKDGSAPVSQWEHVTTAPAGILEVPPVD
jgi:hypothetical protein